MATGGRVVHHLAGMLPDPKHTVVLSGFQAVGTRGRDLLEACLKRDVAFVPGGPFHANGGGENTMRLNFSNAQPDMIQAGIARLGQVLKEELG